MEAFTQKTDDELWAMSVNDLLKHHTEVDTEYVAKCRAYQSKVHEITTAKEKTEIAKKRAPRELSQIFTPSASIEEQLKQLPKAMYDAMKDFFTKGGN